VDLLGVFFGAPGPHHALQPQALRRCTAPYCTSGNGSLEVGRIFKKNIGRASPAKKKHQYSKREFRKKCQYSKSEFRKKCQYSKSEFRKKCQYSKSEFRKKCQYSKNDFRKIFQFSKNEFSKNSNIVRASSERNASIVRASSERNAGTAGTISTNSSPTLKVVHNDQKLASGDFDIPKRKHVGMVLRFDPQQSLVTHWTE
jgi:hypothetical protein